MIEEPYRWVEAIANRREYIETQLASGSAVVALSYTQGILLLTVGEQKLFEIYDRIALGAIGHPGDIEHLRMMAIELASSEGFTRSAADVSLRRLAYYSLSPVMKNAFEQIYGAPFLARLLFAELGSTIADDLFLRVEYDGAITTSAPQQKFAVLGATKSATERMQQFLERDFREEKKVADALELAVDTWAIAQDGEGDLPSREESRRARREKIAQASIAAVALERPGSSSVKYRALTEKETATLLS